MMLNPVIQTDGSVSSQVAATIHTKFELFVSNGQVVRL